MGNISTTTDTLFEPLTVATAPEASRPMLEKVQKSLGFIPNLMAIFANNATVLEGYLALSAVFEKGSFTPRERQIILLAASAENNCNYRAAVHSQIAKTLLRTPAEVAAAIQNNTPEWSSCEGNPAARRQTTRIAVSMFGRLIWA